MPGLTRVKEFVASWYSYIPLEPLEQRTAIFAAPIDRETSYLGYVNFTGIEPKPTNLPIRPCSTQDLPCLAGEDLGLVMGRAERE